MYLSSCLSAQVVQGSWMPTSLPPASWAKPLARPANTVRIPPLSLLDGEVVLRAVMRARHPSALRNGAVSLKEQPKPAGSAKASNVLGDIVPPLKGGFFVKISPCICLSAQAY